MREWATETKWAAAAVGQGESGEKYRKEMLVALGD